ncbi:MAG: DNA-binding domain-containing protein [Burkholderiaceae bacterium]
MTRLAEQQQALLQQLFTPAVLPAAPSRVAAVAPGLPFHGERGMRAYRANGLALAERSLSGCFPVLAQLLGAESFTALAREFWLTRPPSLGDLAQWGDTLPLFLQAKAQLAEEPYLADVARIEWALHVAAAAEDAPAVDMASFALLASADPATLALRLASGTQVLASAYPAASITNAHLDGSPSLAEAGAMLRAGASEQALVWRAGLRPRVRPCSTGEAALILAMVHGASLLAALEAAPALDFQDWLAQAVRSGLVLGSRPLLTPA